MKDEFLIGPVPNEEAAEFLKAKPAVSRQVFDGLLPELKARALAISGIEHVETLQRIRETLAELPLGEDYDEVKGRILNEMSPYFVDHGAAPEEQAKQLSAANRRAELLLRIHGFQAYSAAAYRVMDRQRDVFEYWQYRSMGDHRVRETHAALDGIVLPAGSKFWERHFPPWEWGCRCQVIPIADEDVEQIRARDASLPIEKRRILEGAARTQLEDAGRLVRGVNEIYDVRTPIERGRPGGFEWSPGDLGMDAATLKARYDAQDWAQFQRWAEGTLIPGLGQTVWDWMSAGSSAGTPSVPTPPVVSPTPGKQQTLDATLSALGIDASRPMSEEDARRLLDSLVETTPRRADEMFTAWQGTANGALQRDNLKRWAQELLDMIPPGVATNLPKLKQLLVTRSSGILGEYSSTHQTVTLNRTRLQGNETTAKATLWHEIMHHVHLQGPAWYRQRIKDHFNQRTAGETIQALPGHSRAYGKKDRWYNVYAGRIYGGETDDLGREVPTLYIELLTDPKRFRKYWNTPENQETLRVVMSILFEPPQSP